jgi:hypothetical protein
MRVNPQQFRAGRQAGEKYTGNTSVIRGKEARGGAENSRQWISECAPVPGSHLVFEQHGATMLTNDANAPGPEGGGMPLLAAADLQDHLMTASHDLERLQTLLSDACDALMTSFYGASAHIQGLRERQSLVPEMDSALKHLGGAVTALQFQDMASQLIAHTSKRLRNCCDRLARDTMGDDEDGSAIVEDGPLRPNPVTQDEMDAGSIDLF